AQPRVKRCVTASEARTEQGGTVEAGAAKGAVGSPVARQNVPANPALFRQMERHAGDDRLRAEEQRALDQQRALIVQQGLPPSRRYDFGENDRHVVVGALALELPAGFAPLL